jgi:hypothetical protein
MRSIMDVPGLSLVSKVSGRLFSKETCAVSWSQLSFDQLANVLKFGLGLPICTCRAKLNKLGFLFRRSFALFLFLIYPNQELNGKRR